jgi:hypothetical protein
VRYRKGICAACALRDDLSELLRPEGDKARQRIVDALTAVDRPQSIFVWMRNPQIKALLADIGSERIAVSHVGLDGVRSGRYVEHLRAVLVHHGLLPKRDVHLAAFERWLE